MTMSAKIGRKRENHESLTLRLRPDTRAQLEARAEENRRSISGQADVELTAHAALEAKRAELERLASAETVRALRLAGLTLLSEADGQPRRVVLDYDQLLEAAFGIARGPLATGFIEEGKPAPPPNLSADERETLLATIRDLERQLAAARARAPDAA
jgi:hypothetical protein